VEEEAEGQAERESHAAACILFIFLWSVAETQSNFLHLRGTNTS
jgi:hypothetical protein